MSLGHRDVLELVLENTGADTHAAYPTATFTLCGLKRENVRPAPISEAPSCESCATTARTFRRIDQSAPAEWFFPLEATA